MTGDEGSDGTYYSVIVVPEGIYNILSGIEGDTMGTVRKQGVRNSTPLPDGAGLNVHYSDKASITKSDWA